MNRVDTPAMIVMRLHTVLHHIILIVIHLHQAHTKKYIFTGMTVIMYGDMHYLVISLVLIV